MKWVVKLQSHGGQYRVTLPCDLLIRAGLENEEIVRLESYTRGAIVIEKYYGKGKEESGIQEDKS